jgi:hypothetical protein
MNCRPNVRKLTKDFVVDCGFILNSGSNDKLREVPVSVIRNRDKGIDDSLKLKENE